MVVVKEEMDMKKTIIFGFIILMLITMGSVIKAERYAGEIIQVDLEEKTLVLRSENGQKMDLKLAEDAELYYNNIDAALGKYTPVTQKDYVSGYLETNEDGLIKTAHFYYLVREGVIVKLESGELVLRDTESGICNTYITKSNLELYLNHLPAEKDQIISGMKALVILNYQFQVKKLAVIHYDYTGFIEEVDVENKILVINIGTRLQSALQKYQLSEKVMWDSREWTGLEKMVQNNTFLLVQFVVEDGRNIISYLNVRSL